MSILTLSIGSLSKHTNNRRLDFRPRPDDNRIMSIIDYEPVSSTALATIGYTARWTTYEDGSEVAEILDRDGEVVDCQEAWTKAEACDWVVERAPEIVLDALS